MRPASPISDETVVAARRGASLLETLQGVIERTYRMETGVGEIGRFVIGDEGYRRLYGSGISILTHGAAAGSSPGRAGQERRASSGPRGGHDFVGAATRVAAEVGTATRVSAEVGAATRVAAEVGASTRVSADVGASTRVSADIGASTAAKSGAATRDAVAVGSAGAGAKVLVRDGGGEVAARIYYPDALIASLECHPPAQGLGDPNVDAFATFVEELDHFLLIAERTRYARPVSLLELELHAGVTKYLVCALFLSRGRGAPASGRIGERERQWLRWHLFEKADYAETDPDVQSRYRDAARYARKFLGRLDDEPLASVRLERLRAFHDASPQRKLAALS